MTRRRGRPATGMAQTAAERMRAYRRRLRERGIAVRAMQVADAFTAAVRFRRGTLLTPAEQDVIRRFCIGLRRLPRVPARVAVFGSRAKGGSGAASDLDLAVLIDGPRDAQVARSLNNLAQRAGAGYADDKAGIYVKAVPVFREDRRLAFFRAIRDHMESVWTRPR